MARKLLNHIVSNDVADQLLVEVIDTPGAGGACHDYLITLPPPKGNSSPMPVLSIEIPFQNGPIAQAGVNGVTHESLLAVLIDRLQGFQGGQYRCRENAIALTHLEEALMWLQKRTRDRIARGVEGTLQP